ncbi:glycosyltransferase family 4 protein [Rhodocyclus tenuis]|uniref:Glycosyltransferase family 4 protein n=1 Tax=Rhodocyclus gracilis TaxID=2929842 RepID=A0ABX0WL14_9RHOO|nr:glycosyltransferase family 4 protein [Rhodocyclus gracilis]MRD74002.1 glycosyltransferase [Rhodocyclus gracilis]NJA89990.1 glycosyltransferase family 4 protein [Rhodocyclus gracilis]
MKIAVIRQRYNPFGGAERFVERALGALAQEGAEVSLITRSWQGAELREGFHTLICDPPAKGRVARDRSFAQCAQTAMAEGGFDITQAHERIPGCMIFRAGDGVHAAWLDRLRRVRGPLGRLGLSLNPYHRYVLAAERAMFAHPNLRAVICNSRMVRDEIIHYYGVAEEKLHVIYNGVDLDTFHPDLATRHRHTVRAAHGIDDDAHVFLFVGSGFERKGVPQLLAAFARLGAANARLIIVGADRKLDAMRRLASQLGIADRTLFTGPLQDVKPWYGAADTFVLPTLYDPCPNAALEALACGLPIITSTACGAAEFVREGKNGRIVAVQDIEALMGALAHFLGSKTATRDAARMAIHSLSLTAMAQQLLGLYRSLLPK